MKRARFYGAVAGFLVVALNAVAYWHAYRMTHFAESGRRTRMADGLGVLFSGVTMPKPTCGPMPAGYAAVKIAGRLEAWDAGGEGDVVLMFPGHAVAKSTLLENAKLLRELGCRPVLVDFPGTVTTLGWNEAEDVAAALQWAGERAILFGESMGAAALLRAVAKGAKPAGIIVECPFDRLSTTVSHRYHTMKLPAFPFAQLLLFWGGLQHGFDAFEHNPVEYARHVTMPALVIGGENDPWVKPAELRSVAEAMRGPTTVRVLPAGHGAYAWTTDYRRVVSDWLQAR